VAIVALFKQLQDIATDVTSNTQMITFVLAIEEYLIAEVKNEFTPVIEVLMGVLMLIQTSDHL
jgi:NhaP-type Na+/H+ or K+/H+ antiporter